MRSEVKPFLLSLVLVAVLPNIALVALAGWLDLGRPYVNLDYIFVALLIFTPLRIIGIVLFICLFALDLLASIGQIFLFIRLDNLLYLAKFLPQASGIYQLSIAGLIILLLSLITLFALLPRFSKITHALILFNLALLIYGINVYTVTDPQKRLWRVKENHLVDSQLLFLLDQRSRGFLQSFDISGPALSDKKVYGASSDWFDTISPTNGNRLMLIAGESWGIPHNNEIQQALLSPLKNLTSQIQNFAEGQFDFTGPTVAAELRELCQLSPLHYNLKDAVTGFENCLPNQLQKLGYKTYAMHGATGVMYDRIYWYPRAGFSNTTFFETQQWPRRCFSFPGACDIDMIKNAEQAFMQPEPIFLYWLTLNSHSVYDPRDILLDTFDCLTFEIPVDTQTCRNLKLQAQFFFSLAQSIEAGNFSGVEVIIVGDHDPIITNLEEKAAHFVDNKVPWIKFSIRDNKTEFHSVLHGNVAAVTNHTNTKLSK
jgi:hypothetical protein